MALGDPLVGQHFREYGTGQNHTRDGEALVASGLDDLFDLRENVLVRRGNVNVEAGVTIRHTEVNREVQTVLLDGHLAGGQDFHLGDLGTATNAFGQTAPVVINEVDQSAVIERAVFEHLTQGLSLVDLLLDEELFNRHALQRGARTDVRLSVETVNQGHSGKLRTGRKTQVLSFEVLGLTIREDRVADVVRTRNQEVLAEVELFSLGQHSQNIGHVLYPPYLD